MKNILSIQSHVVYGHAGNAASVFPIRRSGVNVWPLNAVQFSNHTQYPQGWKGMIMPPSHLGELAAGLEAVGALNHCDAVLTGYIGSAEQGKVILDIVSLVKQCNPQAVFFCDTVMGDPVKGCKVAPGVAEFHRDQALEKADLMSPNVLELSRLVNRETGSIEECLAAARELTRRGPRIVLVKHLSYAARDKNNFEMLLVEAGGGAWHIQRPLIEFPRQPVGVGDLTSGLFLAAILKGMSPLAAFEFTTAAVYEVILATSEAGEFELQLVAAQDRMLSPRRYFTAQALA
ncbi:MAG: pyridoxal kinase PdxY [Planctomycetota bacterium]|nr:pyridoxal kinase PdxY [Planctomycetota bacterium]